MRDFSLVQEIDATVDEHWRTFFAPEFERHVVEQLRFRSYETLEHADTDTGFRRTTRAVPQINAPGPVAKLIGSSFGYVEEGTFDNASKTWRTHTIPNTFSGRMFCDSVMRVDPTSETSSTRTLEFHIEARLLGIGGMVESTFENQLRKGWADSVALLNGYLRRTRSA